MMVEIRNKNFKHQHKYKNQTNDVFKLLCHGCNHQQGFLKQKIAALHHCSFSLKLSKYFYFDRYFG